MTMLSLLSRKQEGLNKVDFLNQKHDQSQKHDYPDESLTHIHIKKHGWGTLPNTNVIDSYDDWIQHSSAILSLLYCYKAWAKSQRKTPHVSKCTVHAEAETQNCPDFPDDCQFSGLFQNSSDFPDDCQFSR